jgi:hypothetical protein
MARFCAQKLLNPKKVSKIFIMFNDLCVPAYCICTQTVKASWGIPMRSPGTIARKWLVHFGTKTGGKKILCYYRIFRRTMRDFLPQKQLCHVHCVHYEGALYIQNLSGRSWKICENKKLSTILINWSKPCITNCIAAKPAEIGLKPGYYVCILIRRTFYKNLEMIQSLVQE